MASTPLSPQAKRLRTIIVTLPIMGATALILYKRVFLGEEQRKLPRDGHGRIVEIKPQVAKVEGQS
ncbi:hypothetical protein GLOTRDRAFT_50038 [Gloeophyllum trabeum ATCC 11539]|uniref:Uncharacterized protein n=1 Tax=Gloeophyllum trabeum (strain ATCC 11539 / FP-39264 / Madison 617) TaxID=670483 RepID=S7R944_GLOTA|nr:uncharacterized protein GLOTRDRAFT_50038 [Gloeophyllum trabeum ATCC 11539]EPQ50820.1 hypothetical protein GLOTRDRAFT_50038 [Gloeophyllum trabeum ATCC 11539]